MRLATAATRLVHAASFASSCRALLLVHRLHSAEVAAVAIKPGIFRAEAKGEMHPASCTLTASAKVPKISTKGGGCDGGDA